MLPTVAFAADTGKAIQLVNSGSAANISGSQEDSIYFGTYRQSSDGSGSYNTEPVKWRVLSNADGKMFLLADQNLDVKPYNSSYISITWEKSTIRSWLNGYGANENSDGTDYSSDNFIGPPFQARSKVRFATPMSIMPHSQTKAAILIHLTTQRAETIQQIKYFFYP